MSRGATAQQLNQLAVAIGVTAATLEQLGQVTGNHLLSLYLPATSEDPDSAPGRSSIRLKNAIKELRQVTSGEKPSSVIDRWERQLKALDLQVLERTDEEFTLAVFVSDEQMTVLQLPYTVRHQIHVGDRFQRHPLHADLLVEDLFYTLVLDKDETSLFETNVQKLRRLDLGDTYASTSVLKEDADRDGTTQFHSAGAGRAPLMHDQDGGSRDKKRLQDYLKYLASRFHASTRANPRPVVLVGVEYVTAEFCAQYASEGQIVGVVHGSPAEMDPADMLQRSVAAYRQHLSTASTNRLLDAGIAGVDSTSSAAGFVTGVGEVAEAASCARVRTLYFYPAYLYLRSNTGNAALDAPLNRLVRQLESVIATVEKHGGDVKALPAAYCEEITERFARQDGTLADCTLVAELRWTD